MSPSENKVIIIIIIIIICFDAPQKRWRQENIDFRKMCVSPDQTEGLQEKTLYWISKESVCSIHVRFTS